MPVEEQKIFVRSVKEIYAPLSARLRLNEIKNKLEDASFKFLEPQMYEQLSLDERLNKQERKKQVDIIINKIYFIKASHVSRNFRSHNSVCTCTDNQQILVHRVPHLSVWVV